MGTPAGLTLADISNVFIMMAALAALFVMLVLLLRNMAIIGVLGEGEGAPSWGMMKPPRLFMQRVHIPFTFKLQDGVKASYSDVECVVSSGVEYEVCAWWGVSVRELHAALWGPLAQLRGDKLGQHCAHRGPANRSEAHGEKCMRLGLERALSLGPPPRGSYPLVVVLTRDRRDDTKLRPDDTVALITVVHIQDDACPLPSGVLAQYLKQANGQLSCLKQLYVTGEGESGAYEEGGGSAGGGALCCVCAARPLSRALLPCRHACLCAACFPKLDKCPLCRSGISSYFCIRAEGQADEDKHSWTLNSRLLQLYMHRY